VANFKAPPGTDLPAIPVPLLQQMENSNTLPKDLVLWIYTFLFIVLYLLVLGLPYLINYS